MKRRTFLWALGALAATSAMAQPASKAASVGVISGASQSVYQQRFEGLKQGLREHGYVEGRNLRLEVRYLDGKFESLPKVAQELAALPVDVIVTAGSHVTRGVRKSTRDIPIVMAYAGDPVGGGLADSLSRPGGRITGLTTMSPQLGGKRLELLKDALPKLAQVGVLWNPDVPERVIQFEETQAAAVKLGVSLQSFEARRPAEIDSALKRAAASRLDALIVMSDGFFDTYRKRIVELAVGYKLATLHQEIQGAQFGGLLAYGPSHVDLHRRAASYVDKILKGAKPGELPIEQPNQFELIVNLKTAKKLGIVIPKTVLLRADTVIE